MDNTGQVYCVDCKKITRHISGKCLICTTQELRALEALEQQRIHQAFVHCDPDE